MPEIGFFELLFGGLGVMLIVEGLLPLLSPGAWRGAFEKVLRMNDGQIRFLGLASLVCGAAVLWVLWG